MSSSTVGEYCVDVDDGDDGCTHVAIFPMILMTIDGADTCYGVVRDFDKDTDKRRSLRQG